MPLTQAWLDHEAQTGGRVALHGSPAEIKGMYAALWEMLSPYIPKPSPNVTAKDGVVDEVKYRVYNPVNATGPLPTAIWTHGGGYMTGDLESDDALCRVVAEHTNSVVVNVDYRLTPDFTFPTQLEDSLKVYRWAHENASSIGADPNRFYTIGGSAGGGLALSVALSALKDSKLKSSIKGIAAIVPVAVHPDNVPQKYASVYKSYTENAKDVPIIDKESMDTFFHHAKADPTNKTDFPLLDTENHKNFPPTYFVSCEFDPLRDDAKVMEMALKEAGVPTKHDFYPGLPHYFWIFPSIPEAQTYVQNLIGGVMWLQSQM